MAIPRQPLDHRHARMLLGYMSEMEAQEFVLYGTEVPYCKANGHGFIDIMMYRRSLTTGTTDWIVTEIKTDLVDIGRTLRQVLAAREFLPAYHRQLFKAHRAQTIRFPLVIWASDANLMQCLNYSRLFKGIDIQFHHPDPQIASAVMNKFQIHSAIAHAAATPSFTRHRFSRSPTPYHDNQYRAEDQHRARGPESRPSDKALGSPEPTLRATEGESFTIEGLRGPERANVRQQALDEATPRPPDSPEADV